MAFLNSIKRAFGFGEADFDNDMDNADGLLSDDERPDRTGSRSEAPAESDDRTSTHCALGIDENRKQAIFDSVAKLFNASLPEFIASSIDPEKQRTNIYNALDDSLKAYLDGLAEDARRNAEIDIQARQDAVKSEMEKLKSEVHNLEQQRSSIKEQQLSSDRRRRALTDRVRDLEEQVARLEAEREQFDLENKSLLNKIKVSEIQPGIVEGLQAEIKRLTQQLEERAGTPDTTTDTEETELLRAENKSLKESNAMLGDQHRSSLAVINGLQHDIVELKQQLADTAKELEKMDSLQARAEEARLLVADIETFRQQMTKVEQMIAKRDERIARLKSNNKNLKSRIAELENALSGSASEPAQLYSSGKNDKSSHTVSAPSLFDDNEFVLGSDAQGTPTPAAISSDDLAEIDDEFEAVDWLVSSPPEGTVLRPNPNDPEFGYHEPPRRPTPPENDAQLSLF